MSIFCGVSLPAAVVSKSWKPLFERTRIFAPSAERPRPWTSAVKVASFWPEIE